MQITGRNKNSELCHTCGDDCHCVDLFGVAAAGEIINRCVESLKDRTVCSITAETLCNLVSDIAGFDQREDKCICLTCDLGIRTLGLCNLSRNRSIELELAVDDKLGINLACLNDSIMAELHGCTLSGSVS